jgi:CheY-like chemotaxis protein
MLLDASVQEVKMTRTHTATSILVVDDDADVREGLCDLLVEEGFSVASAANGADALDHLRQPCLPDVVVLDLRMPKMDGYEFLKCRQADEKLRDVPVIVVSATPDVHGFEFPVWATLVKPLNFHLLLDLLDGELLGTASTTG